MKNHKPALAYDHIGEEFAPYPMYHAFTKKKTSLFDLCMFVAEETIILMLMVSMFFML